MFKHIAILGAGTMGSGLALLFAANGMPVSLYDPSESALHKADEAMVSFAERHARDWPQARSRVRLTGVIAEAVQGADLVLEAGPEKLDIKREIYREITPHLQEDAIVASNTSSLALSELADGQPFADRFMIAHFFNPPTLIPLVEIVKLPETRSELAAKLTAMLEACGKAPVTLHKDCPGFIANRLQAAVMREACRLLADGVADAEQIDRAVKEGPGLRWALNGPFEIADFGGLDIWERVTDNLFPTLDNGATAPQTLRDCVREGKLGVKSGAGFYRYEDEAERDKSVEQRDSRLQRLIQIKKELIRP
jgi:3-hydroxybutyryl-CoA dehydrogenase